MNHMSIVSGLLRQIDFKLIPPPLQFPTSYYSGCEIQIFRWLI